MMSDSNSVSTQAPVIDHDLSCMSCGYNLRALAPAGLCPECGTDIARSTQGDLLKFADRKWVGSVYRGTCLLTIANAILVVCILAAIVFPFILVTVSDPNTSSFVGTAISMTLKVIRVCSVVAFILMMLGVWLITKQEPRVSLTEQAASSRGITRVAVGLLFVLYGLTFALTGYWHTAGRLLMMAAFFVVLWSCLKHLELIGRRLPAEEVVTQAEKRRRRVVRGAIAFAIFWAARAATPSAAVSPPLHVTLLNLGATISGIYLFFSTIVAIDSLGKFRPFLRDVLDDAGDA